MTKLKYHPLQSQIDSGLWNSLTKKKEWRFLKKELNSTLSVIITISTVRRVEIIGAGAAARVELSGLEELLSF